ncbi:MAG: hypothetical protein WCF85_08770 [Rhodospirillaceae bacterium]
MSLEESEMFEPLDMPVLYEMPQARAGPSRARLPGGAWVGGLLRTLALLGTIGLSVAGIYVLDRSWNGKRPAVEEYGDIGAARGPSIMWGGRH